MVETIQWTAAPPCSVDEQAIERETGYPAKANLEAFAVKVGRSASEIGRIVGARGEGISELLVQLEEQINAWRRL